MRLACSFRLFLRPRSSRPGPIRFEDTTRSGNRFTHSFGAQELDRCSKAPAGCGLFDYNKDGYQDLYVVSGPLGAGMAHTATQGADPAHHNHLYRTTGRHLRMYIDGGGGSTFPAWSAHRGRLR